MQTSSPSPGLHMGHGRQVTHARAWALAPLPDWPRLSASSRRLMSSKPDPSSCVGPRRVLCLAVVLMLPQMARAADDPEPVPLRIEAEHGNHVLPLHPMAVRFFLTNGGDREVALH